ncbi:protein PIP82 isoform X2 [Lucilia cuprina]|uniref:protein PIP82 isoform X2 n=1 Tax=Lucilia cuprina TaxID=7375 RepID=UPI001F05B3CD|nr:protein PIP82 isoform X2 [Lucilia cuprina]
MWIQYEHFAISAKIPPLPQIKLPKSMSKLKSRKIFRSSREDVNLDSRRSSKRLPANSENIPPLGFINRTPTRISTISSLMNQTGGDNVDSKKWRSHNYDDYENSYRSAGGIDDYPSPLSQRFEMRSSRPISPIKEPRFSHQAHGQSEQNIKMSFGEKLQKGYKDVTEFKLKHLFAKKTVVHTDKIEITDYIQSFDEDRRKCERVQQKRDNDIADNYTFQFKESKQKSEESYIDDDSLPSSPQQTIMPKKNSKNLSELSGDESGMDSSPPPRKPGIASTRFSKVRHTPLNMSLEDDYDNELDVEEVDAPKIDSSATSIRDGKHLKSPEKSNNSHQNLRRMTTKATRDRPPPPPSSAPLNISMEEYLDDDEDEGDDHNDDDYGTDDNYDLNVVEVGTPKKIQPNTSSLYDIKTQKPTEESVDSQQNPRKFKSIKERMSRLSKQKSEGDDTAISEKKRKAPLSPQPSEENEADSSAAARKSDKPFDAIKQNFKRIQKSVRLPQQMSTRSGAESENEEATSDNKTKISKSQQFTERLKRFRSIDNVNKNSEDNENSESPIHKFTNKLQDWRKSFRKKDDSHNTYNDDMDVTTSPQKQERNVGSLMKRLKHIRARKRDSIEDPDDDEEGGDTYKESLAARAKFQLEKGVVVASQVPQITMKKISETKKYFKKKHDNEVKNRTEKPQSEEEELEDEQEKTISKPSRPPPPIPRPYFRNSSEEDDDDVDNNKFITKSIAESQLIAVPAATAVWATKPMITDDEDDYDEELPRVLLHQDNSDIFESTLIIAVTRPISRTVSPIITELSPDSAEESTPDTKPDDWIPNQDMVATFLEMTPPSHRRLSKDSIHSRGHSRKHSIDSSSEDSWIKDIPKGPSTAYLNSVDENEEPWKIQKTNNEDNLYKTKSIDLFEMQKKHGGVLTAFEDFDDELKNTPVVRIEKESSSVIGIGSDNTPVEGKIINIAAVENENVPAVKIQMKTVNVEKVENENTPTIKIETESSNVLKVKNENISSIVDLEDEKSKDLEIPRNVDYYERESSEELEIPDDDNSSRVTKISSHRREPRTEELQNLDNDNSSVVSKEIVNSTEPKRVELKNTENGNSSDVKNDSKVHREKIQNTNETNKTVLSEVSKCKDLGNHHVDNSSRLQDNKTPKAETKLKLQHFGNSQESLTGHLDENKLFDSGEEEDNEESDDDHQFKDVDSPPSKSPSPPPTISTTPPPLPQRKPPISLLTSQPSIDLTSLPPPILQPTKPPVPPKRINPTAPPPKIPDRISSTTRVSRPLVKTASLRLAYSEQVNPQDIGKVNKLISRFEPEGNKQRPKIIPRKPLITYESDDYSDEEDLIQLLPLKPKDKFRDTTPTNPTRIQKSLSIDSTDIPNNNVKPISKPEIHTSLSRKAISQISLDNSEIISPIPSISISSSCLDVNSNFSQPSSVYGSPLAFPSSLVGSTEVTPLTNRKDSEHLAMRRSRRSLARDDDHFYSFDSDEENSYYSISSTGSNRYVVDL